MEIEHLYEFTVVAKLSSFSRAAEELCISQSALSKHMIALERDLGASLLERHPRSVSMTETGKKILPVAEEIYQLQNKLRTMARSSQGRAPLRLASIPVMAQYDIIELLGQFQRLWPDVTLEVVECEQQEVNDMLEQGRSDLAFVRLGTQPDDRFEYMEFCRDRLVAVVHREHPLAESETLSLKQLEGEPLLFLDQRTGLFSLCEALCRQAGLSPQVAYTGRRPENLVELCAQNMGIALLMKRHTDYVDHPEVVCVDVVPQVESSVCLMRRKDQKPDAPARAFWDFVSEHTKRT